MFHGVDGLVEAAGYDVWQKEMVEDGRWFWWTAEFCQGKGWLKPMGMVWYQGRECQPPSFGCG